MNIWDANYHCEHINRLPIPSASPTAVGGLWMSLPRSYQSTRCFSVLNLITMTVIHMVGNMLFPKFILIHISIAYYSMDNVFFSEHVMYSTGALFPVSWKITFCAEEHVLGNQTSRYMFSRSALMLSSCGWQVARGLLCKKAGGYFFTVCANIVV